MSVKGFWNPSTCAFENDEYLASIISDWVVTCDEFIDRITKSYEEPPTKFQQWILTRKTKCLCKVDNF